MTPTLDLVYLDAGGGHRAAALALRDTLAQQGRPWTVRLLNLSELLDRGAHWRRLTGLCPEAHYNRRLARGWTLGLAQELKLLQALVGIAHRPLCRVLGRHWRATRPDLVVSLIPNFNRALGESLAEALPGVPFATVITDLADLPPRFWIEPRVEQQLICGTLQARRQALNAGVPQSRVNLVSGMLLRPGFYDLPPLDRRAARTAAGLDPDCPTAAVMYGGQGSAQMLQIARELPDLQLILFTGHNRELAAKLQRARNGAARVVLGFTSEVPHWLRLADFFIGKPGPGCLSEALHLGLPVLTFENAWTLPQERFNAQWVRELGVGQVLRSPRELPAAVAQLLLRLDAFRTRVGWLDNRAVFEVAEILAELLQRAARRPPISRPRAGTAAATAVGASRQFNYHSCHEARA